MTMYVVVLNCVMCALCSNKYGVAMYDGAK